MGNNGSAGDFCRGDKGDGVAAGVSGGARDEEFDLEKGWDDDE